MLLVVIAAIVLIGPGRYGLDAGRGWARRPFLGSFAALILGVGGRRRDLGPAQRRESPGMTAAAPPHS